MNVEPGETRWFEAFTDRWWDPQGPMRSLHAVNPLRVAFITRRLDVRGQSALDVGCGGGLLTEALARLGARATGIDLACELVNAARVRAQTQGLQIDYDCTDAEELVGELAGTFDLVTCMEVLEHVPQPAHLIAACARLLKPGGHAFLSTIDRNLKSFLFAIVGAEYVLHLLPRGSHRYGSLVQPRELRGWASANGLEVLDTAQLAYNPLTRRFRLAPGLGVNYLMHFVKV